MTQGGADEEGAGRFVNVAIHRQIDESGIFCLCRTADNLAMWSYYGADEQGVGLKGFAIGYELETLLRTLTPDPKRWDAGYSWRHRLVFDVAYRSELELPNAYTLIGPDSAVDKMGPEFQKMHATKATDFVHEDEVRIVITPAFKPRHAGKGNDRLSADGESDREEHWQLKWLGHGAYGHAREAIREIVFGELIEPVHEEMIRKSMAGRGVVFKRAIRDRQSFGIRLIDDPEERN